MSIGGVVLLPLAGVLADIGWRVPFLVYTVALVLLPAMAFGLPEPSRREPTGNRPTSLDDLRQTLAELPLGTLGLIAALGLIGQIIFYMTPVQIPFYLETRTGASGTVIGAALAASTGAGGVASLLYGRIRRSLSVIGIVALTFALMSIGYAVIGVSGTVPGVVGLAIAGAGSGFLLTNLNAWIAAVTPESVRGRALSALTSAFFLGQFLSPLVIQPVRDTLGLGTTFVGVGVLLAGGAIAFVLASVSVTPLPTQNPNPPRSNSR
jgi:MFS family permease